MIDALRFEWTRIRTLRSTYWLIGLAVLLSGVVALIIAVATRSDPDRLNVVTVGSILTGGGSFATEPSRGSTIGETQRSTAAAASSTTSAP